MPQIFRLYENIDRSIRRQRYEDGERARLVAPECLESDIMQFALLIIGVMFVAIPAAKSQVALDVAKISCDQFTGYKITDPKNIEIWLNGFYNGKRGSTIIDPQTLSANSKLLLDYCLRHPQMPVMQAAEALFGTAR